MKLKNKILLYTSVLFIILLIVINSTIYFLFKNIMVSAEISGAEKEIENIVTGMGSANESVATNELLRAYVPADGKIQILGSDGKNIASSVSPSEQELVKTEIQFYPREIKKEITVEDKHYYFYSVPMIWKKGNLVNLQITKSIQPAYDQSETLRTILLAVTFIATLPVVASSRLMTKLIITPIQTLTKTMKDIMKSNQFKRIPLGNSEKDELYQMGETFNQMMDLLETNFKKQEQFIANASHELKTPLTVIESYAGLLKRRGLDKPEVFHESVDAIRSEAVRMREMTEQLLQLARPEESWNVNFHPVQLNEILERIVKSFCQAYHREIRLISDDNITVTSDEQKLKQLLYIIIENAIKYSEEEIKITLKKEKKTAIISVIDRGIGIPKEELPKIFDRFYRVDKARSRKYGGTGLGLSLAKEIANAISATIDIDSSPGLGTSVSIRLPLG